MAIVAVGDIKGIRFGPFKLAVGERLLSRRVSLWNWADVPSTFL